MFASLWLRQLRRHLFGRQLRNSRRKSPSAVARRRVCPRLELLEDRLAPSADLVQTSVVSTSIPYSETGQTVQLTANVTDTTNSGATVNEGLVKFTVVNSTGKAIVSASGSVTNSGSASANLGLPANLLAGSYTIDVSYSDGADSKFSDGGDTAGTLTITPAVSPDAAATTIQASSTQASYSSIAQDVSLTASVTSSSGTVNEGKVQFTVVNSGGTTIGAAVSGSVTSNGSVTVTYSLPAYTVVGSYTIEADYTDSSGNFAASSDNTHTLTVDAASTTTSASAASATYSTSSQQVTLNATVTSNGNAVSEGKVKFIVVGSGGTSIGTAATGTITSKSNGSASVSYGLPAYTLVGSYTIEADYSDSAGNYTASSDDSHDLTVTAATTTTTASTVTTTFSASDQTVTLSATVTSGAGTVNEGSVTFLLFDSNGNTVGSSVSGTVSNGTASASFVLPGGSAVGSYTIMADYSDSSGNFSASSDDTQSLIVNAAAPSWSLTTAQIVPDLSNMTAQVTLTAQVSSSAGSINEGVLSFTLAGVTKQVSVVNGTASVQLTLPLQSVMTTSVVTLSYSDSGSAGFTNSRDTMTLAVNVWNAVLPTNLTFSADGNEQIKVLLAGQSLFGYTYSASGLLTQINISSLSMPVTYTPITGGELATIDGVPWQITFLNSDNQSLGIATLALNGDGSTQWLLYDSNGQLIGALPS